MSLSLVKPTVQLKKEYLSFYEEWKETGEKMIPWVIKKDPTHFEEMVQSLLDSDVPEGWVPDSTYWLVNEDNRILGVVNIRHRLTELLHNSGGHIAMEFALLREERGTRLSYFH
ncbi:acetyltransferase [Halalkalibacter akibai JCM 9157]|uniref:Acetyltransferase n=1 Tax=Halalkalibacter akibai (strain ATCC 43226 / DSM 21942 / CIP 109018 / JCM 9157 / 1139) TaxID=1236973 RepID=W4QPY6_HALA3|nr:acetyltransferase [Halalkalibacter akibai JCM 9157]